MLEYEYDDLSLVAAGFVEQACAFEDSFETHVRAHERSRGFLRTFMSWKNVRGNCQRKIFEHLSWFLVVNRGS
ncbi:hypothetical protein A2U01_0084515 [Trifolium medium]|uniref:Uncharacterized protein n=1 Tax=Trifolium medium TaxID=97028 RepID=A0A392TQR6_9FABA|nr:hypothetical protein [Trifolium medium]